MSLLKIAKGIKLDRVSQYLKANDLKSAFYEQQKSCQIPQLDFLLELFLGKKVDGVFVEVGAHDGISCSNTWGLAKRGWQGYLIEAIPEYAEKCRANHAQHSNVTVKQVAIGGADHTEAEFTVGGQLTTANTELSNEYKKTSWAKSIITETQIKVPMMKLDTFLEESRISNKFDLLVVDVEGYEAEVFGNFDISLWQPKMIIVELTETHPDLRSNAKSDAKLGQVILSFDYVIVYKDSINTVFVKGESWKEALGV